MPKYRERKPNHRDVLRIVDLQLQGVIAAHSFLRDEPSTQALSLAVNVGLVMLLGSFPETLRVLAKIRPEIGTATSKFKSDFEKWERMRDGAAHTAEKIFESR